MTTNREIRRKQHARLLRAVRRIHRTTAILSFFLFFILASTGIILGWKKNSSGKILPETYPGTTKNLAAWLPLDSLHQRACDFLRESVGPDVSMELERIDIRTDKGMLKFVFEEGYREIQLDGATGELLHAGIRYSDLVENIHDGTIVDRLLGIRSGLFKLAYTTFMGLALLIFTGTGFWLWYGPKRMRRSRQPD